MPWVNVVRAVIPLSLCDLAAAHLIKACGGEEVMRRTLGGTKWWQVRGTQGYAITRSYFCPGSHAYTDIVSKPNG